LPLPGLVAASRILVDQKSRTNFQNVGQVSYPAPGILAKVLTTKRRRQSEFGESTQSKKFPKKPKNDEKRLLATTFGNAPSAALFFLPPFASCWQEHFPNPPTLSLPRMVSIRAGASFVPLRLSVQPEM
jgi:hypothetical protein